jgi:hypothetical protein
MEQKQEMLKYGINPGRELLEELRNKSLVYESERIADANWLEKELREAGSLLEERGEFDSQTVLQMQILVKLNCILSRRYSNQLNRNRVGK